MRIKVFATLRDLLGVSSFEVPVAEGATAHEVLSKVAAEHPAFGAKLWDVEGRPTGFVTVLLNGRSIEYLGGLDTPVGEDDTLSLFPPVGGG